MPKMSNKGFFDKRQASKEPKPSLSKLGEQKASHSKIGLLGKITERSMGNLHSGLDTFMDPYMYKHDSAQKQSHNMLQVLRSGKDQS